MDSTVVWSRRVEPGASSERWTKLGKYLGIPAVVLMAVAAAFGGIGAALGVAVLAALIGLLVAIGIFAKNVGSTQHPTVTRQGNELVWAKRRVPIDAVARYSTFQGSASFSTPGASGGVVSSSTNIGTVRFGLVDGTEVEFKWSGLPDEELDGLRAALDPILPGRWQPVDGWYQRG